jgi:hypothetical protein
MDPWVLISDKERQETSASTQNLVAWRAEKVYDKEHADPNSKGYKAVMADLVAFLISFTDAFDSHETPQGVVRKSNIGVRIVSVPEDSENPTPDTKQMVLERDEASPIRALMIDIPSEISAVLIEDVPTLVTNALISA